MWTVQKQPDGMYWVCQDGCIVLVFKTFVGAVKYLDKQSKNWTCV